MSLTLFKIGTEELRESLKSRVKEHTHEIVIGAVMTGMLVAVGIALTGDISQALGYARGR